MKRTLIPWLILIFLLSAGLVSAKGTQEKDFQEAQGKDNFAQSVDLTKLAPGQYNILVRTKDAAGNVSFAGPYNFYYDPNSDNPLITVANPAPGQRLASSLNVVGVASAPKGMALVETQVDGGAWVPAKGSAFWTFLLATGSLSDGLHQIAIRGTDVNGVVGPTVTVPFHVDQNLPTLSLPDLISGNRVQGVVPIAGTLADGNSLASLEISTDDRATWAPISLQGDAKALSRAFATSLDTKKFPDGPLVVWFRAIDGQGSETRRAVLLFVDNTVPVITVLSPPPKQGLHGKVRFAIQVEKTLGIMSLTARVGEKGSPVSLGVVPGNPFHVVDLELPTRGSGTVPVIIEAVDTAGKLGTTTYLAQLNGDTDLPEITLRTPLDQTQVRDPFRITGTMKATDGPSGLAWTLNGSPEVIQPVGTSFDFLLPGLKSGVNRLVLTPIDANLKRGKPVPLTFTAVLPPPRVSLDALVLADQEVTFRPGLLISPDKKSRLRGTLTWPNPMKSVSWTLGNGQTIPLALSGATSPMPFSIPLPDDPPFGTSILTITATDLYDQVTTMKTFVDIVNLAKPQGAEGTAFADPRVGSPLVVVTPETPLRGSFTNGKIRSADLLTTKGTVPTSVLQVTHDDQFVVIKAVKDGQFEGVKLRVINEKGRIYDTELGSMTSDIAAPAIGLASPLSGTWVRENLRIDGQVSDTNGLAKLEWSIDNGRSWQQLDPPSGNGGAFTRQFTLPGPDNMVNLLIRATDQAGRTGTVLTVVRRDTEAPTIELSMPSLTPDTKGAVMVVGRLKDEGALQKAETVINKKTFSLPLDRAFTLNLDAATAIGSPLFFRVTDWAGNVTEQNFTLPVASPPPADAATPTTVRPEIQILFPRPDTKGLNGVIPVVGRVIGFTTTPQLAVKGEATGDTNLDLTDAGFFTLETNLSLLKSRGLSFSATVTESDAEGKPRVKESASANLNLPYDAASELPQARFLPQTEKPILTGNVTASGWIGDSRGVVSWVSQLDGGEKKVGTPEPGKPPVGTFLVDLGVPAVGPHKLTVWPVNALGKEGLPAVTEFVSTVPAGPVEFTSFDLGASLSFSAETRIQGRVPSINSWRRIEIRFADLSQPDAWNGPFQPLEVKRDPAGSWTFDVAVPASLPYSRIGVVVRGEDSLGQKVEGRTLFHRVWLKDVAAIQDNEGLFFFDDRLQDSTGRFNSVPGLPLVGTFRGRPIKGFNVTPALPAVLARVEGNRVFIDAKEEGLFGPFTFSVITIDNETFTSNPITLFADTAGPVIDWEVPLNAEWIRDSVPLKGKVTDPSGVATLDVSVDGGTSWQPLAVKNGLYDGRIPVPGADGLVLVVVKAVDKGGHVTVDSRAVSKDTVAPTWTLVAPPQERKVNGLTTLIGSSSDFNPVTQIEYSDDGKTFKVADGTGTFAFDLDFASYAKVPDAMAIRTTDAAGNRAVTPLLVPLDQGADKPVVQIQTPAEGEVLRSDFAVSGMAFDDDGVKSLSWRLDGGTWLKLDGVSSFQIPIPLNSLVDNEHAVEVQAEDLYGTKGDLYKTTFKVSLENPSAVLVTPEIDRTVSGIVGLVGASFDRNGIELVQISLDNGLTWNRAELRKKEEFLATSTLEQIRTYLPTQRQEWEWRFDSKTLKDGTYLVMIKTTDRYATEGLSTTLVNLDNSAPDLTLTSPTDGQQVLDSLDLEGRTSDNIKLVSLKAELRPIDSAGLNAKVPASTATLQTDLPVTPIFNVPWNLGTLAPGWYNLRLEAKDAAGNSTYVARNVRIEGSSADKVEILYPQAGETLSGSFRLEGRVSSRNPVPKVLVNLDGKTKVVVDVDDHGYYSVLLDGSLLEKGEHNVVVTVQITPTSALTSEPKKVLFNPLGPWIQVQSHQSGSYVTQRPFMTGLAGWNSPVLDPSASVEETQKYRQALDLHKVISIEASLDNGKTWSPAQGTEDWKYRLETLPLPDGPQPLVFRAKFKDGSTAFQRMLVIVSQTPPQLQLLTPIENGRFNGTIDLAGFTEGDGEVQAVEVAVRQGDKAGYEVPQFIQGMYLDTHFLGATTWETSMGFTFVSEAVKLQAQIGQTPEFTDDTKTIGNRFWGTVVGGKLIASVLQLPAGFFFGPDWSWLSSSVAVGATFNQFSMTPSFLDFSSANPVMLGGVVLQWEVARAKMEGQVFFNSYSWYNEATVWFISSDVQAESKWTFSTGFRIGLF